MNDLFGLDELYKTFVKFKKKQDNHILASASNKPNDKRISLARNFYKKNKYYPNRSYDLRSLSNKKKRGRRKPRTQMAIVNIDGTNQTSSIPIISFNNLVMKNKKSSSPKSRVRNFDTSNRDRLFIKMKQRNMEKIKIKISKKKDREVRRKISLRKKRRVLGKIESWNKQGIKNSEPLYKGKSKILKDFEKNGSIDNSFRNRYIGDQVRTLPFKIKKLDGHREPSFFIGGKKSEQIKPLVSNPNDYIRYRPKLQRRRSIKSQDKRLKSWSVDVQSFDSSVMDPYRF